MAGEPRVVVGFHSTGSCPTQFAIDLARAFRYSGTFIPFALHEQSCYVDSARNNIVKNFLKGEGTHLMMIDVDISFDANAFVQAFEILRAQQADGLYGNYVLGNGGNSIFGPPENLSKEAAVLVNLQPNVVYTDISTGGTGWLLVTRQLLERMQKECKGPWHWFDRDPTSDGKDKRGEDVTFGLRVWALNPRPKMVGSTVSLLRHFKTQPVIPMFMTPMASSLGLTAIGIPNPYEDETKFIVNGHQVIQRAGLTPEQIANIEMQIGKRKEGPKDGPVGRSDEQVQEGQPEVGGKPEEGDQPQAGSGDNALREAEGSGGQGGVQEPPGEAGT